MEKVQHPLHLKFESQLNAPHGEVRDHAFSMEGINAELAPWIKMTGSFGTDLSPVEIEPPGRLLFTSWLLLLGFIPLDRHRLFLYSLDPAGSFDERSTSWLQRHWLHHREIVSLTDSSSIVRDELHITPRIALLTPLVRSLVRAVFARRHRYLHARFGVNKAPSPTAQSGSRR